MAPLIPWGLRILSCNPVLHEGGGTRPASLSVLRGKFLPSSRHKVVASSKGRGPLVSHSPAALVAQPLEC